MKRAINLILIICGMFAAIGLKGTAALASAQTGDDMLTDWVMAAIAEDPRIISEDIKVAVKEGVVTLSGEADNIAERRYADLETKKVKGVRGVINRITVKTVLLDDYDLQQLISRRIQNSSIISSKNIGVTVKSGEVVLYGTATSYVEKQEASLLAGEVRGVMSVDNQMKVEMLPLRPDDEIQKDIQNRFGLDVYLVDEPIEVHVTNGVATLGGRVANPYLKDRAMIEAYQVRNVTDVHDNIKVEWNRPIVTRGQDATPSDRDLTHAVEVLLSLDQRIKHPLNIHVSSHTGHVVLSGRVDTYRQARVAARDARGAVGVCWVDSKIQVKPVPRNDDAIHKDARFNIDTDVTLFGDLIKVSVDKATVLLTGTVHSHFQKVQAEKDVARVLGVADLVDNLDVYPHERIADSALKAKLAKRMDADWATWPASSGIDISVNDGQVTLSGLVDNWQQYSEAARIAQLTAGVMAVNNHLMVLGVDYDWGKWYGHSEHAYLYDTF